MKPQFTYLYFLMCSGTFVLFSILFPSWNSYLFAGLLFVNVLFTVYAIRSKKKRDKEK